MQIVHFPLEEDFKKWVREVIREEWTLLSQARQQPPAYEEPLLTRKQIASYLNISLVTLTDWVRRGLPCIRKGGRVLFLKSEVLEAIKGHPEKRPKSRKVVG
jgi:excisionase family DNA binding protein